ncbi:hypothetical protein B4U80_14210, partial [Leptotrombidium deliense]
MVKNWAQAYEIIRKCANLQRLYVLDCEFKKDEYLENIGAFVANIQLYYYDAHEAMISCENNKVLLSHCTQLQELRIQTFIGSPWREKVLLTSEDTLEYVVVCTGVECLDIVSRCKNIKHLGIFSTGNRMRWNSLNWKLLNCRDGNFTRLETLQITWYSSEVALLINIIKQNKKLKVLEVHSFPNPFSESHIKDIAENCKNLRIVKLPEQQKVAKEWFSHLLTLPSLEMLCLVNIWSDCVLVQFDDESVTALCEFIQLSPSIRVIQTDTNINILKTMVGKANQNP